MYGYVLVNKDGEYLKEIDGANAKLEFTSDLNEAKNYDGMPGGGEWFSNQDREFIVRHFKEEYGERATTLRTKYMEW